MWRTILTYLRKALTRGSAVSLTHIGTLAPFTKQATQYRHPETGEMETARKRKHVRFILSPTLKRSLRRR